MPVARFIFAAVTAALWAWGAAAQSVDVVVKGVVTDQTGAAVRRATVTVRNAESGLTRTGVSDAAGIYRLAPVPPGVYTVTAQIGGFPPQVRSRQVLHVGTTVTIDFVFDVVSATETVEVVSGTPLLETTTNTLSRLVAREELELLPVVDRRFHALASLAPGVTPTGVYGGVDISGSRDFQNGYYVDGVSAEGLGFGDQRVTYAQDWIQEFQVLTGRYEAEFGGSSGGVLTAITRSGSNAATGGVYGFFRNGRWDAKPAFADSKASLDMERFGGTAGGKLIADRLFFFGGFEWYDNDAGSVVHTAFPELNGNVPTTADQKLYLVKLEH
ncbi:MAG TPA: carboxypeptidase-like regulatory domain-containing protein, partial [Thermoanaerobaculia bacterium]|nr:carboxypeptidase-like regulatory domain-containing protein [Thermoanaerobaculia bacterium]